MQSKKLQLCSLKTLFLFLFCTIGLNPIFADHIIGGDITYRFISESSPGVNQYEFTMIVYRDADANGANLDNPAYMAAYRGDLNFAVLEEERDAPRESIVTVPPDIPLCAVTGSLPLLTSQVQKGVYRFTMNLEVLPNESWIIVYQRCCRTSTIRNVTDSEEYGSTYLVEITPLAQQLQNSSPVFNNPPPNFICNRFTLDFDHSATDADGDSLVYEFCDPLHGGGRQGGGGGGGGGNCNRPRPNPPCAPPYDPVPFEAPYTTQNPMGGVPMVAVNSATGKLSGTPTLLGNFVVGLCVKEYRNGQLLSSVLRDFQFTVVDCESVFTPIVDYTEVLGYQEYLVNRCGEIPVTVKNTTVQVPDIVAWEWRMELGPGNTYISNDWDLTLPITQFGTYTGWFHLNPNMTCSDSARVVINAFPGATTDFEFEYDICEEAPVSFTSSSFSGAPGGIVETFWDFGTGDTSVLANPSYLYPASDFYNTSLTVTDSDGCKDTAAYLVDWTPQVLPADIEALPIIKCAPGDVILDFLDTLNLNNVSYNWDLGNDSTSTVISPSILYQPGVYDVGLELNSIFDCYAAYTFEDLVQIYENPTTSFDFSPRNPSTFQKEVRFFDQTNTNIIDWEWRFGETVISDAPNPIQIFQDTGLVSITLVTTNSDGCQDSMTQVIDVEPLVQLYVPNAIRTSIQDNLGNERFQVLGVLPGYKSFNLGIWDRWGALVFQTDTPDEAWFGYSLKNNKFVQPGAYVYKIQMVGPRGKTFDYQGILNVVNN